MRNALFVKRPVVQVALIVLLLVVVAVVLTRAQDDYAWVTWDRVTYNTLRASDGVTGTYNTLRVYGRCQEQPPMPYPPDAYTAPLSIESPYNPPKDFVVFNPAILRHHGDEYFLGFGPNLAQQIKAGQDANEKVHLRMWYVPKRWEPKGETYPPVPERKYESSDIVLEYTYMLLQPDGCAYNPTQGPTGTTQIVFPMAGLGDQIGLDRFDVNNDTHPEILLFEEVISPTSPYTKTTHGTIVAGIKEVIPNTVSKLVVGNTIEFFDYMVKVLEILSGNQVRVEIYYIGNRNAPKYIGAVTLYDPTAWPGGNDAALVKARHGPITAMNRTAIPAARAPVVWPFWVTADYVGSTYVTLKPHRILHTGESFFVDGAEYDIPAILIEPNKELKYITIRNPLPKCIPGVQDDIKIDELSVIKECIPVSETIPVLPPFNIEGHEIVDDINIPDCLQGDANVHVYPDYQMPDNIPDPSDSWYPACPFKEKDEYTFTACTNPVATSTQIVGPDGCGDVSLLDLDYNTIWERIWGNDAAEQIPRVRYDLVPVPGSSLDALQVTWIQEEKEPRFDTNLLEEKFTEIATDEETWKWKNIETLPWDYTDFKLPEVPDVTADDPDVADKWKTGDYILVSSFLTEDSITTTIGVSGCIRMKFVFDPVDDKANSADIYVNDADYNAQYYTYTLACRDNASLRIYGRCQEQPPLPYPSDAYTAPLSIQSPYNPPKDFVVFNPAFLDHWKNDFFMHIKADADANEKVHLRTWYVPKRPEPKGATYPEIPWAVIEAKYKKPDIVNEYTYIFLDANTNDPTHGSAGTTQMVFPMAGIPSYGGIAYAGIVTDTQIGLDRYDVNGDGTDEILAFEEVITPTTDLTKTINSTIVVAAHETEPNGMRLAVGDYLQFFDYMVKLNDIIPSPGPGVPSRVQVGIYYIGNNPAYSLPDLLGTAELQMGAGNNDAALVTARHGPVTAMNRTAIPAARAPVVRPFWVTLEWVGTNSATLIPHRILTARQPNAESFFVDSVEYDVAAILIEPGRELKYITLRNPLPKESFWIEELSIRKVAVLPCESLPMLPPFNMTHDMVDDINIPDCIPGDSNTPSDNSQRPDNVFINYVEESCTLGCGDVSGLDCDYNTIAKRVITDVAALDDDLLITYIEEDKEERFDTNLLEEKFTETLSYTPEMSPTQPITETWRWKNIETLPWDYTELVLPPLPDITDPVNNDDGDYILVSSFLTEDAITVTHGVSGCIRMKFYYDAAFTPTHKTGIYVNTLVITPTCTADAGPDQEICAGGSVMIGGSPTASGGTPPYTCSWSPTTGLDDPTKCNPTASPASTTTYTVTVTDSKGCTATDSMTVTVNPNPVCDAGPDEEICEGGSVVIGGSPTASGGTPPYTCSWSPTTGLDDHTKCNPTASPASTTCYTVTCTDSKGCSDSDTICVTVNPNPTADAGPDEEICAGDSVVIGGSPTASGGTPPYTCSWSPTTGLDDHTKCNPTASPASTTTYTVTVTDSKGCTATDSMTVTVNPNPVADAGPDEEICAGDSVVIGGSPACSGGTPPYTCSWSPTTGLDDHTKCNPIASPASTTTYCHTCTDSKGCTDTDCVTVTVNPNPVADAGPDREICVGDSVVIGGSPTCSGGTPPCTCSWSPTTGLDDHTKCNPTASPGSTTTYTVTVTDSKSCTDTDSMTVMVNTDPIADAGPDEEICAGDSVVIGGAPTCSCGTPPHTCSWSPTTGLDDHTKCNPTASPGSTTTYTVTCTDSKDCTDTDCMTVTVNPNPEVDLGPDIEICECISVEIRAEPLGGTPPYTCTWSPPDWLDDPTKCNPTAHPPVGVITYTLTVTDSKGCTDSDSIVLTVNPNPTADAGPDKEICEGESTEIGGDPTCSGGTPPYTCSWSPTIGLDDPTECNPTASPITTTTYCVTCTDSKGCTDTDCMTVIVNPKPTANAGYNKPICKGGSTGIGGDPPVSGGTPPYTCTWSPPDWLEDHTECKTIASPPSTIIYTLTVTDSKGCTDDDSVMVSVHTITATADSDKEVCVGATIVLTGGPPGMDSYYWTGPNNFTSTLMIPTIPSATLAMSGVYTLTVDKVFCANTATTMDNYSCTGPGQCSCTGPGQCSSTERSSTPHNATTAMAGDYSLTVTGVTAIYKLYLPLVAKNYPQCVVCTDTVTTTVTVNPNPTANAGPDQPICEGGSTEIGGNPTCSYDGTLPCTSCTCRWSPTHGLDGPTKCNPIASPSSTTTYCVTCTDSKGCTGTDCMTVTVNPNPTANARSEPPVVCLGQIVKLYGNGSGGRGPYSCKWSSSDSRVHFKDPNSCNTEADICCIGSYPVTLEVTDANGCKGKTDIWVDVCRCKELICQGDFEIQPCDCWIIRNTPRPAGYSMAVVHSGSWSMRLGITYQSDVYSYSSVYQKVTIPGDAKMATLSFWYYPICQDTYPNDWQAAVIYDSAWRFLAYAMPKTCSNSQTWTPYPPFDLTPYKGQTIILYFNVYNNGGSNRKTAMYLDDVSVQVCY